MNEKFDACVSGPAELISVLPSILGFRPEESFLVCGVDVCEGSHLNLLVRVDLADLAADGLDRFESFLNNLVRSEVSGVILVAVSAHEVTSHEDLPHVSTMEAIEDGLTAAGVEVLHRVWAADTTTGSPWRCYDEDDCAGQVADPASNVIAAAVAASGLVTYDRREDLVATLAPADDDVLARRADLLAAALYNPDTAAATSRDWLRVVDTAIDRAMTGTLPETDQEFVNLAIALSHHDVRDACMDFAEQERCEAAELLWTALVRGTPAPECAEAASLVAYRTFVRGDGVLAGIAIRRALDADPDHRFSALLEDARTAGLAPENLRMAGMDAAAHGRAAIARNDP